MDRNRRFIILIIVLALIIIALGGYITYSMVYDNEVVKIDDDKCLKEEDEVVVQTNEWFNTYLKPFMLLSDFDSSDLTSEYYSSFMYFYTSLADSYEKSFLEGYNYNKISKEEANKILKNYFGLSEPVITAGEFDVYYENKIEEDYYYFGMRAMGVENYVPVLKEVLYEDNLVTVSYAIKDTMNDNTIISYRYFKMLYVDNNYKVVGLNTIRVIA